MKLILLHPARSLDDNRYRIDVLAGVANPIDVQGDGYALDLLAAMTRAMYRLPTCPEGTRFEASADALELYRVQTGHKPENFRGLPIVSIEQAS